MAELTWSEARQHAEAFLGRVVRPFEKLPEVLRAAEEAEQWLVGAEKRKAALTDEIARLLDHKAHAEQETATAQQARGEAQAALASLQKELAYAQREIERERSKWTADLAAMTQAAERSRDQAVAQMQQEIRTIQGQIAEAKAVLRGLGAKIDAARSAVQVGE